MHSIGRALGLSGGQSVLQQPPGATALQVINSVDCLWISSPARPRSEARTPRCAFSWSSGGRRGVRTGYPLNNTPVPTSYPQLGITLLAGGTWGSSGARGGSFSSDHFERQVINTVNNPVEIRVDRGLCLVVAAPAEPHLAPSCTPKPPGSLQLAGLST